MKLWIIALIGILWLLWYVKEQYPAVSRFSSPADVVEQLQ